MDRSTYKINKGINRSIVFRGLKGQYIWYAGAVMFIVMILYVILYVCGINTYVCLLITVCVAAGSIMAVYQLSASYGEHGLTKALAARKVPGLVKATSRKSFINRLKPVTNHGKATG